MKKIEDLTCEEYWEEIQREGSVARENIKKLLKDNKTKDLYRWIYVVFLAIYLSENEEIQKKIKDYKDKKVIVDVGDNTIFLRNYQVFFGTGNQQGDHNYAIYMIKNLEKREKVGNSEEGKEYLKEIKEELKNRPYRPEKDTINDLINYIRGKSNDQGFIDNLYKDILDGTVEEPHPNPSPDYILL